MLLVLILTAAGEVSREDSGEALKCICSEFGRVCHHVGEIEQPYEVERASRSPSVLRREV